MRTLSLSLLEPSASFPLEMLSQQLRSRVRPSSSSSLRALQRHKRLYATLHEDAPSTHPTEKEREPEDGPKEVGPSLDQAASASEVTGVASVDSTTSEPLPPFSLPSSKASRLETSSHEQGTRPKGDLKWPARSTEIHSPAGSIEERPRRSKSFRFPPEANSMPLDSRLSSGLLRPLPDSSPPVGLDNFHPKNSVSLRTPPPSSSDEILQPTPTPSRPSFSQNGTSSAALNPSASLKANPTRHASPPPPASDEPTVSKKPRLRYPAKASTVYPKPPVAGWVPVPRVELVPDVLAIMQGRSSQPIVTRPEGQTSSPLSEKRPPSVIETQIFGGLDASKDSSAFDELEDMMFDFTERPQPLAKEPRRKAPVLIECSSILQQKDPEVDRLDRLLEEQPMKLEQRTKRPETQIGIVEEKILTRHSAPPPSPVLVPDPATISAGSFTMRSPARRPPPLPPVFVVLGKRLDSGRPSKTQLATPPPPSNQDATSPPPPANTASAKPSLLPRLSPVASAPTPAPPPRREMKIRYLPFRTVTPRVHAILSTIPSFAAPTPSRKPRERPTLPDVVLPSPRVPSEAAQTAQPPPPPFRKLSSASPSPKPSPASKPRNPISIRKTRISVVSSVVRQPTAEELALIPPPIQTSPSSSPTIDASLASPPLPTPPSIRGKEKTRSRRASEELLPVPNVSTSLKKAKPKTPSVVLTSSTPPPPSKPTRVKQAKPDPTFAPVLISTPISPSPTFSPLSVLAALSISKIPNRLSATHFPATPTTPAISRSTFGLPERSITQQPVVKLTPSGKRAPIPFVSSTMTAPPLPPPRPNPVVTADARPTFRAVPGQAPSPYLASAQAAAVNASSFGRSPSAGDGPRPPMASSAGGRVLGSVRPEGYQASIEAAARNEAALAGHGLSSSSSSRSMTSFGQSTRPQGADRSFKYSLLRELPSTRARQAALAAAAEAADLADRPVSPRTKAPKVSLVEQSKMFGFDPSWKSKTDQFSDWGR